MRLTLLALAPILMLTWVAVSQDGSGEDAIAPTTQPSSSETLRDPRQAEVFRGLLPEARRRSVNRPSPIQPTPISVPQAGPRQAAGDGYLLPEGTALVERRGRLLMGGDGPEFKFDSDNPSYVGPRVMGILPNSWLETMEREAEAGVSEFFISATVTRYKGKNYLYLHKYRRQTDHGNLSP